MARVAVQLTNFTGGELSPRLDGRNDLAKYASGCKTLQNMIVYPHGSAARRSGTSFVAEVENSAEKTRLIPFEFSTTQTYILEFGNEYIRFYKDGGAILEANKTITGITQADPGVVSITSHGFSNGDTIVISGVVGMTEVNGKRFKVANVNTNDFELQDIDGVDVDTTSFTAYASGGIANRVYQIATTYLTADLFQIKYAQSADVMYLCHPEYSVKKLSRTGHTSWSITEVDFTDGPYLDDNITATTLGTSAHTVGSGVTLTASAITGINSNTGFQSTDIGRLVSFRDGYGEITAFTSTTVVTITIIKDMGSSSASTDWALGAFSDTTGYPSCVTFYEQRLIFAGTEAQPQTLYFSRSGDYENMDENRGGTIADDDAIIYTIASNQVNAIRFLSATRTLIVGTVGGEFSVSGGGSDDPVTPTNILIKKQSNHGCANTDAIPVGNVTLFLQRAKRKVRELAYNFDVDGYVAPDMTILAEHISESGFNEMSYQQEPNQIIWAVREDGQLAGLTYQREQQVVAWHRHIFGGSFGTGDSVCETVATIPTNDKEYQTWVIVKRTIDGVTRRYVEYINEFDFNEDDNTEFNFLDSQLIYSGATTTLDTTINNSVTSIILTSATSFTTTGTIKINNEIITYTGISSNTLTGCVRGTNSTTAAAHTSGVTVSQVVNSVTGLDHLEGQTVSVLAGGSTHPDKTVASGAITLTRFVNDVKVGLSYTSLLQTMRIDAGSQNGTSQAKTKRIYNITVRLYESIGVEVGPDLNNMESIPFRSSAQLMNTPIPVFTGDKEVEFRGNYETDGHIYVRQTQPLPLTVLSLYPELITNDG
jgi:hypothetical protein